LRPATDADIPALDLLYRTRPPSKFLRSRADWLGILHTYDISIGAGFYAAAADGQLLETSDGYASAEAGCLLDLTPDRSLAGIANVYMNLMFN
jgi:hypothetical protein